MKKSLIILLALLWLPAVQAAGNASAPQSKPTNDRSAFELALQACHSSASKDSTGRPDIDACMSEKGFKRPDGPPPPHPADQHDDKGGDHAAFDAAAKTCASSAKKDSNGQADPAAMESCLNGKGFKRPDGPPPHTDGRCEQAPPPPPQQ